MVSATRSKRQQPKIQEDVMRTGPVRRRGVPKMKATPPAVKRATAVRRGGVQKVQAPRPQPEILHDKELRLALASLVNKETGKIDFARLENDKEAKCRFESVVERTLAMNLQKQPNSPRERKILKNLQTILITSGVAIFNAVFRAAVSQVVQNYMQNEEFRYMVHVTSRFTLKHLGSNLCRLLKGIGKAKPL